MNEQRFSRFMILNAVLYFAAAGVAGYLAWHHYALINGELGFGSFCSVNQTIDCDTVNTSKYAEVLGIPLGVLGFAYYVVAFALSLWASKDRFAARELIFFLLASAGASVVASVATFGISAGILHKICLMCGTLQTVNVIAFVFTYLAFRTQIAGTNVRDEIQKCNRKRWVQFAGAGVVVLIVSTIAFAQLKKDFPFDEAQFLGDFRAQSQVNIPTEDAPRQGFQGENPPLRIVEFADFQCPACGMAAKFMHRLVERYSDRVQLVFRNFPLDTACNPTMPRPLHPHACLAAKTAYCMHKQGKFVAMYEKLFSNQLAINPETIRTWAQELGGDLTQLDACVQSSETSAVIAKDISTASAAGLQSTPTFFVNGRKVEGPIEENRLRALLRDHGISDK